MGVSRRPGHDQMRRDVDDWVNRAIDNGGIVLSSVGGGLALSSGLTGWLSESHAQIASLGVLSGIAIGVIGIWVQSRKVKREIDIMIRREVREIVAHEAAMARLRNSM